jgi:uncharacterized protein
MKNIIFKTRSNDYLYNTTNKTVLFVPKKLQYVIDNFADNNVCYDEESDSNYYLRKHSFLRENGYFEFEKKRSKTNFIGKLSRNEIKINYSYTSQIIFEVTQKCNLQCEYCVYGDFYDIDNLRNNKDIDSEKALFFLAEFIQMKLSKDLFDEITISFYGGEPLLNMSFIKTIINLTKKYKKLIPFKFTMTTNGVLLHKYIDFLVENNFRITVSLDGNRGHNEYRKFKNKNSYDVISDNLMMIKEKHPDYYKNNLNIISVIHNKNNTHDVLSFIKKKFNKQPYFSALRNNFVKNNLQHDFDQKFLKSEKTESNLNQMNHLVIAKELKSRDVTYKTVYDLLGKELNLLFDDYNRLAYNRISTDPKVKSTPTGTCKPFELRLFFTVDGYLMPCEHIEFKYKFGECTKNNVKIFENEIVKFYNAAYANINKQCRSCYYSNLCSECLFNMEVINDKFICNKYLDLRGFTKLLSATIENLELKHDTVDFVIEDITLK